MKVYVAPIFRRKLSIRQFLVPKNNIYEKEAELRVSSPRVLQFVIG